MFSLRKLRLGAHKLHPGAGAIRIDIDTFEKIQPGMTEKQVEHIIGCKYGQYFKGKKSGELPCGPFNRRCYFETDKLDDDLLCTIVSFDDELFIYKRSGWVGSDLSIWVWFDIDGLVIDKNRFPVRSRE